MFRREKLKILGVDCPTCVYVINRSISRLRGVKSFEINVSTGEAIFEYDDAECTLRDIYMVIRDSGYDVEKKAVTIQVFASPEEFTAIESSILRLRGVLDVGLNPVTGTVKILINAIGVSEERVLRELSLLGVRYTLAKATLTKSRPSYLLYRRLAAFMLGLLAIGMMLVHVEVMSMVLITVSALVLILSYDILVRGFKAMLLLRPTMESLITLSSTLTFIAGLLFTFLNVHSSYHTIPVTTLFEASAGVLGFIGFGLYLEERLRHRTLAYLNELERLLQEKVRVYRDDSIIEVDASNITVGDIVEIKAGSKIPVDGVVINGWGYVDESSFTGEPTPVLKKAENRDPVLAGSILVSGYLRVKATRVGEDTLLAHILESAKTAVFYKPSIQRFADRIVGYLTWIVFIIAISAFTAWFVFTSDPILSLTFTAAVLVVACPCPLGIAIPLAISAGIILASKKGILIRRGDVFEKVVKSNIVVFDKTGTLTTGNPRVYNLNSLNSLNELVVLKVVCSIESRSEHVLAQAITRYCQERGVNIVEPESYEHLPGLGVIGRVMGMDVAIGSIELVENMNIEIPDHVRETVNEIGKSGGTPILIAINERITGILDVRDELRGEAHEVITYFKQQGFKLGLMSGDIVSNVEYVKQKLGLDFAYPSLKPIDKAKLIREIQLKGDHIIYIGDGVNDAIALSSALVGIAMGRAPDLAKETGDVVLLHNDLRGIKILHSISKRVVKIAKQNLFWTFIYNTILIPIAAGLLYPFTGLMLRPEMAAIAMVLSNISVVLNSSRILLSRR